MFQLKSVSLPPSPPSSAQQSKKSQERIVMLPNQLLHPKFAPSKMGKGMWCTLDPRVLGRMREKGSWKVLSPKAVMGDMGGLIWEQLGERVCQEVELLRERFAGRKRLDLFPTYGVGGEEKSSFVIRLSPPENTTRGEEIPGSTAVFAPVFKESSQATRFESALKSLTTPTAEEAEAVERLKVFYAKQSHIIAPLGIALYRLNMWLSNDPSRSSQTDTPQ